MRVRAPVSLLPVLVIAGAIAGASACDSVTPRLTAGLEPPVTSAGRLDGLVTRLDGTPAARLPVAGAIHGVVVYSVTTDDAGTFTMRVTNNVADTALVDTALTVFIQARTAVAGVLDSLVLRAPVAVRMSRNLTSLVITTTQLRAAY